MLLLSSNDIIISWVFNPICILYHLIEACGTFKVSRCLSLFYGAHVCASKNCHAQKTMYYVIQVKTGKEQQAIEDIMKYKSDQSDFDVFAPYRKALRKYHGEFKEVIERSFPGYVFVETNDAKKLFFDLYWVPGYTRLLGREGLTYNFVPLSEEEARMIDILYNANYGRITEISNIEVQEGDKILVLDGPLAGLKSQIVKVNLHKRYVVVQFPLCGRSVEARIGINIISKIYE